MKPTWEWEPSIAHSAASALATEATSSVANTATIARMVKISFDFEDREAFGQAAEKRKLPAAHCRRCVNASADRPDIDWPAH